MTEQERDRMFTLFREEISSKGKKKRKKARKIKKKRPYDGRYMEDDEAVLYQKISRESISMLNSLCRDYGLSRADVLDMIIRKFVKTMRASE